MSPVRLALLTVLVLPWTPAARSLFSAPAGQIAEVKPGVDRHGDPLPAGAIARLGTVRFRHGGSVTALAYSQDGKLLASGSNDDNQVIIWEMPSGKRIGQFTVPGTESHQLVFSGDGKLLASSAGSWGKTKVLQVWEVESGQEILRVPDALQAAYPNAIAFSRRGTTIATVHGGRSVEHWDLATGQKLHSWDKLTGTVRALTFAPDDTLLGLTIDGKKVHLWDLKAERIRQTLETDDEFFASVAVSADGDRVAFEGSKKTIWICETATGKVVHRLEGHEAAIYFVRFSAGDATLLSGSWDGTVRRWDLGTGKEQLQLKTVGGLPIAALPPDRAVVATGGGNSPHAVLFWHAQTGQPLDRFPSHTSPIKSIAYSPDGKLAATAAWLRGDPVVRLWEVATGRQVREFRQDGGAPAVAVSPNGNELASSGWTDAPWIRLWDVGTGRQRLMLEGHQAGITCLAYSPDARHLASGDSYYGKDGRYDGRVRVWESATGKRVCELQGHGGAVQAVTFTPDGKALLVAGNGVHFWDATTWRRRGEPVLPERRVWSLAVSPDGKVLATADGSGPVRLWEIATRREIVSIPADSAYRVAFAPNGRILALGTKERLRLYDWPAQQYCSDLTGNQGLVTAVAFSPDGRSAISAGNWETSALVWDVAHLANRPIRPGPKVEPGTIERWWNELVAEHPTLGYGAIWNLVRVPDQTLPFLKSSLKPAQAVDAQLVARLVKELDDRSFKVRERATQQLEQLGEAAEARLNQVLKDNPAPEQRRRVEQLLAKLGGPLNGEPLRALRAVTVIEQIGTPDAKRLLEAWAGGAPDSRLTQDARAALGRLAKQAEAAP